MSALRKIWADCGQPPVQKIICIMVAFVYATMIVLTGLRMFIHDGESGWTLQIWLVATWVVSTVLQWWAGTARHAPYLLRYIFSARALQVILYKESRVSERTALALFVVLVPMMVLMLIVVAERVFGEYSAWTAWVVKTLLNFTYPAYNLCALRASLQRQKLARQPAAPAQGALLAINSFMVLLTLLLGMETMPAVEAEPTVQLLTEYLLNPTYAAAGVISWLMWVRRSWPGLYRVLIRA